MSNAQPANSRRLAVSSRSTARAPGVGSLRLVIGHSQFLVSITAAQPGLRWHPPRDPSVPRFRHWRTTRAVNLLRTETLLQGLAWLSTKNSESRNISHIGVYE